ncbi:MAG: LPS assembly protein LptD [Nitrospirota bacterium]
MLKRVQHDTSLNTFVLVFIIHCLLFTDYSFAEEQTIITSETIEYIQETSTYIAKGNVKIQREEVVIEADEIRYNEQTSEVIAEGAVRYNDKEISIRAERAELNIEEKTGKLYEADVLFKKDNYHVSGKEIEKKGEGYYLSPEATFTTCDALVPAWCFKGKDVDAVTGDRLKAKDVTFRIKDLPVLYTPYFQASLNNERKTGFLMPGVGYSKSWGMYLSTPFFWAISENRDATVILDIYTKRGIGEGLEYRYLELEDIKGKWWLYHIEDTKLNKDFYEVRALHEQRSTDGIGGFLNINYVNEKDFYREFNPYYEIRMSRFFESTGEISLPLINSRVYLLSQYWIDLRDETELVPQKLPEAGYVLYPTKVGNFWFSGTATASNFWRDEGVYGQRLDIFPKVLHKFGSDVVVSQTLGLRETAYSLHRGEDDFLHREAIEYNIAAHTRLLKRYRSFTHILEPSVGYTLITDSESLPLFDSTELFDETSEIQLSLLNRFINNNGEFMVFRASQGLDTNHGDNPFLPFTLEVGIKKPVSLRLETNYDVNTGRVEKINSDLTMSISEIAISAGQRYNRQDDVTYYNAGIGLHPFKPLYMDGRLWYDAEEREVRYITTSIRYMSQCWGMTLEFIKAPDDFTVAIMFELKGIGFKRFMI